MQFITTLLLTLGLATSTLALPSPSTPNLATRAFALTARQASTNSTTKPDATVTVCTLPDFAGQCYVSTWPVNTCIDLKGYEGITDSFGVGDGFECLVMQGECDAATGYVSVGDSGEEKEIGDDLTVFSWIKHATSYMCFTELDEMRRFVARAKAARVAVQI